MSKTYCPKCGNAIDEASPQSDCQQCGESLSVKKTASLSNHKDHTSETSKKKINFLIPLLIISAFLIGLFAPKIFANSEKEIVISASKSMTTSFFSMTVDEDFAEIDIHFNNVKAELTEKDSENELDLYKITGEFTYDGTTYTFTDEVAFYDGMYMHTNFPDLEEK